MATITKKQKNNYMLYGGIGLVAIAGIAALSSTSSTPKKLGTETFSDTSNTPSSTPASTTPSYTPPAPANVALNRNLILRRGSIGAEVKELQKLLKIYSDGKFGPQTEATLFSKKGVKEITLNNFTKLVTINNNAPAIGSKLMSNNQKGTAIYKNAVKADKSNYAVLPYKEETTVDYGKHVGILKGLNGTKTWFLVLWEGTWGSYYGWVKSSDVKSYK